MKCFFGISNFLEEISSPSYSDFPLFLCIVHWGRLSYLSLLFLGTLYSNMCIFTFPLCLFSSLFSGICKASSDSHFAFLHFFFLGMVLITTSCIMSWTSFHSSSGTLSIKSNPLNLQSVIKQEMTRVNTKSTSISTVQFSSVTQSCPTLCDPINHSMPGLPVHHKLPEFTQTHAHWLGDAIQPSHLLLYPSPPTPNPSQQQGLFQWANSSHEVAKVLVSASASVLPINTQDWSPSGWAGWISLQSKTHQWREMNYWYRKELDGSPGHYA